jgi:hypothetical protein
MQDSRVVEKIKKVVLVCAALTDGTTDGLETGPEGRNHRTVPASVPDWAKTAFAACVRHDLGLLEAHAP